MSWRSAATGDTIFSRTPADAGRLQPPPGPAEYRGRRNDPVAVGCRPRTVRQVFYPAIVYELV
jgi:hypothetical protein